MKTLTNPFFVEMEKGARKAEIELGIELIVKTAAQETSFEQQVSIVEDLVQNKRADALVIAPANAHHLIPAVRKARDAGIPVVIIDARLDATQLAVADLAGLPAIGVDNEKGAYLAVKALSAGIEVPTTAAILEGIRSAENAQARKQGAERAFSENTAIRVVASETANWKIDEAYEVTRKMFELHPGIGLLFAANDMMALGGLAILERQWAELGQGGRFRRLARNPTMVDQGKLSGYCRPALGGARLSRCSVCDSPAQGRKSAIRNADRCGAGQRAEVGPGLRLNIMTIKFAAPLAESARCSWVGGGCG